MPLGASMPASVLPSSGRQPSTNYRRQPRVPHRVPCRLSILDACGSRFSMLGETTNVNDDGLAVQVGIDVRVGVPVEILIPHLDGEPACLYGKVVHRRRVSSGTIELGIQFDAGFEAQRSGELES